jgi:cbb3-type cytochrome oxidase subunit 3
MKTIAWIEHYSVVAMFVVFALIAAAAYWPGRKQAIEKHGRIPLEDDA